MDSEMIAINLWLAGRSYRIKIKAHEEEAVRRAVKMADDKITELRQHYAGKDDQDFIAMCLLTYAADAAIDAPDFPFAKEEIKRMSEKIERVLNKPE